VHVQARLLTVLARPVSEIHVLPTCHGLWLQALTCYRNALRFDGRHYNAMYGVGQIYYRQVSRTGVTRLHDCSFIIPT
jgi:hypothetical protein